MEIKILLLMKKFFTITGILLCILYSIQAKERVIDRPPFITWNSTSIEFDKVVISDTATIVHIKAYYRPKFWIKIATGSYLKDTNTGQLYPLRRGIGITPDKEFWMPDSGEAEFQLVFPPLPETVTSVDFSEGDFDGAYKIWGIQLKEKSLPKLSLPKEAVVHKIDKAATLPQPEFVYGKAMVKGQILDYRTEMFPTCRLILADPVKAEQPEAITINKDGTFQTKVDIITITPAALLFPFGRVNLLIAPGKETAVIVNTRECCRQQSKLHKDRTPYGKAYYFNGYLANLQQELADNQIQTEVYNDVPQLFKDVDGKNVDEVKDFFLAKHKEITKQIDKASLSKAGKDVLRAEVDNSAVFQLCNIEQIMRESYCTNHKLNLEQMREYFQTSKIEIPEGFYNVFKKFPNINTPQALYASNYGNALFRMDSFESQIKEALGTDKGILFITLAAARIYQNSINDFLPLTAKQEVELSTLPSPAYGEMLKELNTKLLKKIELNKKKTGFTINDVGDVSNEELFSAIISKYRGHVVLVDAWATWCGPCRLANREILPMKEELKDKDIIYVYLTGETSPSGIWNNMIPDIHGEHYRVKDNQWTYLREKLEIRGVPTYFIIDREGNTSYKQTGFPGANIMKEQLLKALEK